MVVLPKINLQSDGRNLFFDKDRPFNFCADRWLMFNDGNISFRPSKTRHYEVMHWGGAG